MHDWHSLWLYVEAGRLTDEVEDAMAACLKPLGFARYGHVLHRYVEGDVSQVVEVELSSDFDRKRLFRVKAGLRIPECALRSFSPVANVRYYCTSECDLCCIPGARDERDAGFRVLCAPTAPIITDILARLQERVLPAFEALSGRDAILAHLQEYPEFGVLSPLQKAMIHGRRGNMQQAEALISAYYREGERWMSPAALGLHQAYLRRLADKLGVTIRI